jgi:uncharacterized protein YerC
VEGKLIKNTIDRNLKIVFGKLKSLAIFVDFYQKDDGYNFDTMATNEASAIATNVQVIPIESKKDNKTIDKISKEFLAKTADVPDLKVYSYFVDDTYKWVISEIVKNDGFISYFKATRSISNG